VNLTQKLWYREVKIYCAGNMVMVLQQPSLWARDK
jgi:hypothetical protein